MRLGRGIGLRRTPGLLLLAFLVEPMTQVERTPLQHL
jgi:hypothetical protein